MMKNNHGHIVTIASVAGLMGIYNCTDYSATKFAAIGCHESLFTELKVRKSPDVTVSDHETSIGVSLFLLISVKLTTRNVSRYMGTTEFT